MVIPVTSTTRKHITSAWMWGLAVLVFASLIMGEIGYATEDIHQWQSPGWSSIRFTDNDNYRDKNGIAGGALNLAKASVRLVAPLGRVYRAPAKREWK